MTVELRSEYPLNDEACREATGKSFGEWYAALTAQGFAKRREATNWVWDQVGRNPKGAWWGITLVVEHEKRSGKVAKDGRAEGYGICVTKTVKAPLLEVQKVLACEFDQVLRIREGKDVKAKWQTPGCDPTDVDVLFVEQDGRTGITLNHNRIQTREEADGLRRGWAEVLDALKKQLEG